MNVINVISTEVVDYGVSLGKRWLTMFKRTVETNGKRHSYYFVSRNEYAHGPEYKQPDAVVVVGFYGTGDDMKLVVTDEYRIAIGRREIGLPAGLIDAKDYLNRHDVADAACRAARREFKEETGLDFTPYEVSANNLYSSAGMTDESICLVIGFATGEPSKEFLEEHEDIHTMLLSREEIVALMANKDTAFGKVAWPFFWTIKHFGFPNLSKTQNL